MKVHMDTNLYALYKVCGSCMSEYRVSSSSVQTSSTFFCVGKSVQEDMFLESQSQSRKLHFTTAKSHPMGPLQGALECSRMLTSAIGLATAGWLPRRPPSSRMIRVASSENLMLNF